MMARVMKTTGGRLWLKPWGVPKITKANKANFKKRSKRMQENQVSFRKEGMPRLPGAEAQDTTASDVPSRHGLAKTRTMQAILKQFKGFDAKAAQK